MGYDVTSDVNELLSDCFSTSAVLSSNLDRETQGSQVTRINKSSVPKNNWYHKTVQKHLATVLSEIFVLLRDIP